MARGRKAEEFLRREVPLLDNADGLQEAFRVIAQAEVSCGWLVCAGWKVVYSAALAHGRIAIIPAQLVPALRAARAF